MFGLYPAAQVRRAEGALLAQVPEGSLMQTAARGLATHTLRLVTDVRGSVVGARAVLLVGAGNNGGDALFAGAYLAGRGMAVSAVLVTDSHHVEGLRALLRAGGRVELVDQVADAIAEADVIVDGIVGIGASGALREGAARVVELANAAPGLRIAVDVPSGIGIDDGAVVGSAFEADATVTFGCYKPGLFLHPGRNYSGAAHLVDIGLEPHLPEASMHVLESPDVADLLEGPQVDDYKYRRGVVGIAAGSPTYPGAAVLTVGAARYSGVGMVRYLDRGDGVAARIVGAFPDVVADPGDSRSDERVRAWACGPGFTRADEQTVNMMLGAPSPVVLDAGALECLAMSDELHARVRARADNGYTTVLTPHHGEYVRLFGYDVRVDEIARTWGVIVVRKGPATTICGPDGTVFVDPMGTPDLACAGSGDVLTGLLAGLLATRPDDDPQIVCTAGVWLHGLAGRCAASGERPITASDLIAALPQTIGAIRTGNLAGCGL